jgi:hypothetical protein
MANEPSSTTVISGSTPAAAGGDNGEDGAEAVEVADDICIIDQVGLGK